MSNGEKVENPKYLKKSIEKLKKLQKQVTEAAVTKNKGRPQLDQKQNQNRKTSYKDSESKNGFYQQTIY